MCHVILGNQGKYSNSDFIGLVYIGLFDTIRTNAICGKSPKVAKVSTVTITDVCVFAQSFANVNESL